MKATQKEAREDLMECATAILEDVVLLDCLLESMNQNEQTPETNEIQQGI